MYDPKVVNIYEKIVNASGSAHIVTADGGFDYSVDFNQQERLSYHLIFAEIVTALFVQKNGGHFVCKVFDMFDMFSLKCINLLTYFYKDIYIVKPKTSRPANSEKYIVAKNFIGIDSGTKKNLLKCLIDFFDLDNIVNVSKNKIKGFDLLGLDLDSDYIECIKQYNIWYCHKQVSCINDTLSLIDNKLSQKLYNNVLENQVELAVKWCKKYHVAINNNSYYIKKYM